MCVPFVLTPTCYFRIGECEQFLAHVAAVGEKGEAFTRLGQVLGHVGPHAGAVHVAEVHGRLRHTARGSARVPPGGRGHVLGHAVARHQHHAHVEHGRGVAGVRGFVLQRERLEEVLVHPPPLRRPHTHGELGRRVAAVNGRLVVEQRVVVALFDPTAPIGVKVGHVV